MNALRSAAARISPRHVLIVTGVLAATLVLTVALRGTVRELVVVPLGMLLAIALFVLNSLPQAFLLGVLVVAGAVIVIRSLSRGTGVKPAPIFVAEAQQARSTRLGFWTGRLTNAKKSPYTTERALNEMCALVVDCLAHAYRLPSEDVLTQVRAGALGVPEDVRAVLLEDHTSLVKRTSRLRDVVDVLGEIIGRLVKRGAGATAAMTPAFERKITLLLDYIEAISKG